MFARLLLAVANFFLVVSATRNFLLPNSLTPQKFFRGPWADEVKQSLRVSSDAVPSVESKYGAQSLVYVQYSTKTDCTGEKGISSGITFNVCMTGYDRDGNILGSGIYTTKAERPNYIQASYIEYSTADCTGEATYEEKMNYPKNCMPGTETGSGKFSLADTTDVSTILKDGILYSYYDNKSHCGAEVASTWTWVPYNHCMTSDDGFTHFALTACSNGSYSACTYADAACQTVTICSAVDLLSCYWYTEGPSTGNNGYYYNSYLTQHCINKDR